jgi:hypothetical protein
MKLLNQKFSQKHFLAKAQKAVLTYFVRFFFKYWEFERYKLILDDIHDNTTQLNPKKTKKFDWKNFILTKIVLLF